MATILSRAPKGRLGATGAGFVLAVLAWLAVGCLAGCSSFDPKVGPENDAGAGCNAASEYGTYSGGTTASDCDN
jgi:hypothetical protein